VKLGHELPAELVVQQRVCGGLDGEVVLGADNDVIGNVREAGVGKGI
jgi:hypothetical protein